MADADRPEKIKDMINKPRAAPGAFAYCLENICDPCKSGHKMYNFYMAAQKRYFYQGGLSCGETNKLRGQKAARLSGDGLGYGEQSVCSEQPFDGTKTQVI